MNEYTKQYIGVMVEHDYITTKICSTKEECHEEIYLMCVADHRLSSVFFTIYELKTTAIVCFETGSKQDLLELSEMKELP